MEEPELELLPEVDDSDVEDVLVDELELELTSPHSRLSLIWLIWLSNFLILWFCSWTTFRTSPKPEAAAGPVIRIGNFKQIEKNVVWF